MEYAIFRAGAWTLLPPGAPITIGNVAFSYDTMLAWTPSHRAAQGIRPVEDEAVPDGKIVTGSTIVARNGGPVRVWTLEDAPEPGTIVPVSVTRRQAKTQLSRVGLLSAVDALIAQMPGQEGEEARIDWADAGELRRDHPLILALGPQFNLTPEDIDALFVEAAKII